MHEVAQWYRWMLVLTTSVTFVLILLRTWPAFKDLPNALKLYYTGGVFALLYMLGANEKAVTNDIGFTWLLVPYTLAVFAFMAYALEPKSSLRRRKETMAAASRLYDARQAAESNETSHPRHRDGESPR